MIAKCSDVVPHIFCGTGTGIFQNAAPEPDPEERDIF